jgi:argininosuccinate lyase
MTVLGVGTGRLVQTVGHRVQRIVYAPPAHAELRRIATIDRAHLVMLVRQRLIGAAEAAALLHHIEWLCAVDFSPLRDMPTPRGLYLAYEDHLIAALGVEVGGRLHTARSRNDINATAAALRLRERLAELVHELLRLRAILLSRARAYRDVLMPLYTHHQAALPATYGYYLTGVALALGRDTTALLHAGAGLDQCPLGAGAAAGSELPIDPALTAALLGFAEPARHALDAVASRDVALRALAAAAGTALTLSRLATDLQLWSTAEFGLIEFPDRLVGGSSAMPQKRNAFLLEYLRAKPGTAIGAWTAAATMTRGTPFTNAIEVGTAALDEIWHGLDAVVDAVELAQSLAGGARPVPERMAQRAEDGFVAATALANQLVETGMPFRAAHREVGAAVRRALNRGATRLADEDLPEALRGVELGLPAIVARQRHGGGPGDVRTYDTAYRELLAHRDRCRSIREGWRRAERWLAAEVAQLCRSRPAART